jgi:hypothetical protein
VRQLLSLVYAFVAIVIIIVMTGCSPVLTTRSVAPPGRTARLDEITGFWGNIKSYKVELSQGVALAMTCYQMGPCTDVKITSDDPAVAEVRPASLGVLQVSGLANAATAAGLVVVGRTPGKTTVHVVAKEGKREIAVTIVPPPAAMQTQAVTTR